MPLLDYYLENIPPHIWEKTLLAGNTEIVRTAAAVTQTFARVFVGGGGNSFAIHLNRRCELTQQGGGEGERKGSCSK